MNFFLHDTSAMENEVAELFLKYKYEGTGLYWALKEKLAKQENPVKTSILKYQLGVTRKMSQIWAYMLEIGLIYEENGKTFCKILEDSIKTYKKDKKKNADKVRQWREKQRVDKNVTGNVTGLKPTNNKVNINKGVKRKTAKESIPLNALMIDFAFEETSFKEKYMAWVGLLQAKGKSPTEATVIYHMQFLKDYSVEEAIKIIEYSLNGGYTMLYKPKLEDGNKSNSGTSATIRSVESLLPGVSAGDSDY